MHKSQGFGAAERRGPVPNYFELLDGEPLNPASPGANPDLLDGVTTGWSRIPGGAKVGAILAEAERSFDPDAPHRILPILARARASMRGLATTVGGPEGRSSTILRSCAGLWLEATRETLRAPGREGSVLSPS